MLLISEGIDYDLNDVIRSFDSPPSSASSIMSDIRDTVTMTARSNVSIYAVDPRGLATLGDDTIGVSSFADQNDPSAGIGLNSLNYELQAVAGRPPMALGRKRRLRGGEPNDTTNVSTGSCATTAHYVLAYHPPSTRRRQVPSHRSEGEPSRPDGPFAQGLRAAQGQAGTEAGQDRRNGARQSTRR